MASLFPKPDTEQINLLDPGAGIGSLSTAFIERMTNSCTLPMIDIDCYELDATLLQQLEHNLESFSQFNEVHFNIFNRDFIQSAVDHILNFDKPIYTHAILNPPYQKMPSNSLHRKLMSSIDIEVVNLYTAFVSLSIELLKEEGHLVAIIPRSFCNGTYYYPFRKHLFANTVIQQIHLFNSRKSVFSDDSVLQENVIIHLKKTQQVSSVIVSSSENSDLSDISSFVCPYEDIVDLESRELIISIPASEKSKAKDFTSPFSKLGVNVSTGPVVDFRNRDFISKDTKLNTVPLIYPQHFNHFKVVWPKPDLKKADSIQSCPDTSKQFYPKGYYVVVKRFSSKEEVRRIVAAIVTPHDFQSDYIAFENHLNVYHINNHGLDENLAYGLLGYLNSEGFDKQFRLFSGHTQVNAGDLRRMTYPSKEILISLGQELKQHNLSYPDFEMLIKEYIDSASN
jgi:adenine-specific DNA-methyltransferase